MVTEELYAEWVKDFQAEFEKNGYVPELTLGVVEQFDMLVLELNVYAPTFLQGPNPRFYIRVGKKPPEYETQDCHDQIIIEIQRVCARMKKEGAAFSTPVI